MFAAANAVVEDERPRARSSNTNAKASGGLRALDYGAPEVSERGCPRPATASRLIRFLPFSLRGSSSLCPHYVRTINLPEFCHGCFECLLMCLF